MLIVDKNSQFYSICAIKKGGNTDSGQRNFHIGKFFSSKLLFFEIKNIEPIFPWKVKNMKKCSNHEKLRTIEAHTKITGSYNKKSVYTGQQKKVLHHPRLQSGTINILQVRLWGWGVLDTLLSTNDEQHLKLGPNQPPASHGFLPWSFNLK